MTDMIERVSSAMEAKRRELIHAPLARIWPDLARAAIEAMREPTRAMVRAAEAEFFEHMPEAREWTLTHAKEAYTAAIEAALKGEG